MLIDVAQMPSRASEIPVSRLKASAGEKKDEASSVFLLTTTIGKAKVFDKSPKTITSLNSLFTRVSDCNVVLIGWGINKVPKKRESAKDIIN
jgi:uncharacterized protein